MAKHPYTILFFSAALALFWAACATPQPIFRQYPVAEKTTWYQGREYLAYQDRSMASVIAFSHYTQNRLIFDVEFNNLSSEPILVAPETFYFSPLAINQEPFPFDKHKVSNMAVDPEKELLTLDIAYSRERARRSNEEASSLFGTLVNTAGTLSSQSQEDLQYWDNEQIRQDAQDQVEASQHAQLTQSISQKREFWELQALRKTTLMPGESIRGWVAFEVIPDASFYQLHFGNEQTEHQYLFQQRKFSAVR